MTQTNNSLSYHRRTPSGSNGSKLRTARPVLHRKGASLVNHSISKLGSGQVKNFQFGDDDRLPEMAASFLNFCAMCERQITVPDNTLLYCSESCRRKDSHKPLSASLPSYSSMSITSSPPTSPPMSPRIIVAPLTPTKAPHMPTTALRIPADMHDAKVDLDPTEWKPVISKDPRYASLVTSDAWKYLSQFHNDDSMIPVPRSRVQHRSSASLSTLMSATAPIPSLSHTPSTAASSVSSDASDYMSYVPDATRRPLPPRRNPYFSGAGGATKGVELVVPHIIEATDASPMDMSHHGGIWSEKYAEKASALATLNTASPGISLESKAK
ncbi:hypothetical protein P175DRAFT_0438524 [Aspergillus ochraceoroseus IBT 24754]|uniref:Life-span regulatory factor domain-containing protein n=2 Tax=Aspergillus ochraceoroseus TaxID=138278 RepID=A0A2T5LV03_9EURO|nr:uncharacterized protein P175DRAFT_0438524 [Aspergillus ochraceoroseus IBT 24754]KKK25448.1 hypothetical protein AOCH_006511 [Aspergillus ochraceoroseus]PTU20109.1 hypothetical protein P175DRAFT_0438524 [Aspergillus ochraceoroseus IBT 24754]